MRKDWIPGRFSLRYSLIILAIVPVIGGLTALTSVPPANADHQGCTIEAKGTFENRDSFNGRVTEDEFGSSGGRWVHVAPSEGNVLVARSIDDINCSINGFSVVNVSGSGLWNGEPVEFAVLIAIDNDGFVQDFYQISVAPVGGGTAIYFACCLPVRSTITVLAPGH